MALTALTVTTSVLAGTVLPTAAAVDAVNGNSFVNTVREAVEITNGGGAPITATFTTALTYQSFAIADHPVSVTNATTKVGPFDTALFNDTTTGTVQIQYSSGTSVTIRVISLGAAA